MTLDDDEKRRIARVIWTYSGKKQPDFEAELGFKKDRLRSMLGKGKHSAPTLDELVVMASAAGIPRGIAIDGWAAADPIKHLEERLSDLDADVRRLSALVGRQGAALRELRAQDQRKGSTEDADQ